MGNSDCLVKIFQMLPNGSLDLLVGADDGYFGGIVPNVGDTYVMGSTNAAFPFYSVQRRYFIDSPGDRGWCVIVRAIETAPQLENVVKTWRDEIKYWREVDEKLEQEERQETLDSIERMRARCREKPVAPTKGKPHPKPK